MSHWRVAGWWFASMILTLATSGMAQGREQSSQPASIPVELAIAFSSSGGFGPMGDLQFLVGALPASAKSRMYVPRGGRVVGSAISGANIVSVISIPGVTDSVMLEVERELVSLGWKLAPNFTGGGFRPTSAGTAAAMRRSTFCRENQALLPVLTRPQGTSPTLVYRLLVGGTGFPLCNQQYTTEMRRSPFPTLYNPQGADVLGGNRDCQAQSGSMGTSTQLSTPMTAQAILEHYGRQLQDSGWALAILVPPAVGLTWTRPDSAGTSQYLSLTVQGSAQSASCRTVRMDVQGRRPQ